MRIKLMTMNLENNANTIGKGSADRLKIVCSFMQTQHVKSTWKQVFVGNQIVTKDILKHVGMDPDATEENLVDICTKTQLVVNANSSPIFFITVSFASRVFAGAAQSTKHT